MLAEAGARGYRFDASKIAPTAAVAPLDATTGQLAHEWAHLLAKLQRRNPSLFERWSGTAPEPHPLFRIVPGPVADWERVA